jgi:PKD repeat protein
VNVWDDGYPSGGNYWSGYAGVDLYSGPYQNQTGSDGIGDTPYVVGVNNQDHYPLTIPYGSNLPLAFPTASFIYTPKDPIAPQSVTFNASSCTCVNGSITRYEWDFGDGVSGTGQVVSHIYGVYGNYNVTLTVLSNTLIPDTQGQLVNVRGLPRASFFSSPVPAVGYPVTFDASASDPRGGNITDYVWDFGDGNITSTVDPVISHTYTSQNSFNVTLTVSDSEDLNSSLSKATLVTMPTAVSIHTSSSSTAVGFTVNIGGSLTDFYGEPLENELVVLFYTFPGVTNWYPISSSITNSSGNYYVQWAPQATGYFTIRAEWAGNATHLASNDTVSLSVLPYQSTYAFSVESNSTVSGLTFDANSQTLSFSVSGENGTEGYARVTIAKALVPDITQLEVRLDGIDYNYSAVSLDDSWLLSFTYSHSLHQVEVYLDSSAIPEFSLATVLTIFIVITLLAAAMTKKNRTKRFC